MNILFLTPYPPDEHAGHAGAQLIARTIKGLHEAGHKIHLICFYNDEEEFANAREYVTAIYPVRLKRIFNRDKKLQIALIVDRLAKYLTSNLLFMPYQIHKYTRKNYQKKIQEVIKKVKIDIIQCEYNLVSMNLLRTRPKLPKVLVEHDVSIKPFKRFVQAEKNPLRKMYLLIELNKWMKKEPLICNQFDRVITLTPEDKKLLLQYKVKTPVTVIPPPINITQDKLRNTKKNSLCFVGSFNRKPNIDAVKYLLSDIWPHITKRFEGLKLYIAGKHLPPDLLQLIQRENNVEYLGFVEDIDGFISECTLFLAPIRLGGGFKMKITHSLACGTPVVTTPAGAEGIELTEEDGLFIAKNKHEFIETVTRLLLQKELLESISHQCKHTVSKKYSIKAAINSLESIYREFKS